MPLSVKHKFQSEKADDTDDTLIQPSDWNDEHSITLSSNTVIGRTASGAGEAEEVPIGQVAGGVAPGLHTHPAADISGLATVATTGSYTDLSNTPAPLDTSVFMQKTNDLSDVVDVVAARTNLGLGDSATKNVGTTAGTVAAGDDSRIMNAAPAPTSNKLPVGAWGVVIAITFQLGGTNDFANGATVAGSRITIDGISGNQSGTWKNIGAQTFLAGSPNQRCAFVRVS